MPNISAPPYAELHCLTNFSFLRGASHPEELIIRAAELGYEALAITDECSVAGLVRAHMAAKETRLRLLIGTELRLADGPRLVLIAPNRRAYAQMCALISLGRSLAPKGRYRLTKDNLDEAVPGCLAILLIGESSTDREALWFADRFGDRGWIGVNQLLDGFDAGRLERSARLARYAGLPRLACGDVHMHRRGRRALQDTLTAIRLRKPLAEIGRGVYSNGERHLRSRLALARLYPRRYSPRRCASPSAALSRWTSCATNIPRSWCPRATLPVPGCAISRRQARNAAGRRGFPSRCAVSSSTSSR